MLRHLYIKNYALIDELALDFSEGFTIITGETGAGKSILLGGLALVLGKRADLSQIKDNNEKCIIEATFHIAAYELGDLFKTLDLDYEPQTIIRREILPSGKSRAFVNDTPTNLQALHAISAHLIDIHSQHQTLQLTEQAYQMDVLDALADHEHALNEFRELLKRYQKAKKDLEELQKSKAERLKAHDYNSFLLKELNEVPLAAMDLKSLEAKYDALNNVELITEKLGVTKQYLEAESTGAIEQLKHITQELQNISSFGKSYETLTSRLQSVNIELDDVLAEVEELMMQQETNPAELEQVNHQLQVVHNLFRKHQVDSIEDLLTLQEQLTKDVSDTENLDDTIAQKEKALQKQHNDLLQRAKVIRLHRQKAIPKLESQLESLLNDLGMPHAKFNIELTDRKSFNHKGNDDIEFYFTANKGMAFQPIKKAASGGELSRIMLAVKSILSNYQKLPSIIFDEIDTGISGEISNKMGDIMKAMSRSLQVLTITHLPQIAAKGQSHFKVYKADAGQRTTTNVKHLNQDERIVEIAEMLGGNDQSDAALKHAKQLLN